MFHDQQGRQIPYAQWLRIYRPYYFLGGPTYGRRINGRNQSSLWVESQIDALLLQPVSLSQADLTVAMAWKIGLIDHAASQATSTVVYRPTTWPATLTANNGYRRVNFSQSIPWLAANMGAICHQLASNPQSLFNLKSSQVLGGFGPTYRLTLQFFVSHGSDPIYDRFAHLGALAIDQGLPPGVAVQNYRPVQSWNDYQAFQALLRRNGFQPQGTMFVSRDDDRALWAYGHFF
jgi:hypothetical protein